MQQYLTLDEAPGRLPLTVEEVKLFLREPDLAHGVAKNFIAQAMLAAEKSTELSLEPRKYILSFDDYIPSRYKLERGPILSVSEIRLYKKNENDWDLLSKDNWRVNLATGVLHFDAPFLWHYSEVHYRAGFEEVPAAIRQGMLVHIGHMREKYSEFCPAPKQALELYRPYKKVF